jgi:hypothetical protein
MKTRRLDAAEYLREEEHTDLGDGLTEAELYWWADRKREQNLPCYLAGHQLCPKCRNCSCFDHVTGAFRCLCAFGKKMVTPYRIRFLSASDKRNYELGRIYCLNHSIYESKGQVCSA